MSGGGGGIGIYGCEKDNLETVIVQVRLEGGFKRGRRISVAESLRHFFPPNR